MKIIKEKNRIIITGLTYFDLEETLSCGQCFRAYPLPFDQWLCPAANFAVTASQPQSDTLVLSGCTSYEFDKFWRGYFDIDRDYAAIRNGFASDPTLYAAMQSCSGIRILQQDFWETLISFIISANNNIPRIRGIIERLCEKLGEEKYIGKHKYYTFPKSNILAKHSVESLCFLRAGFRTKYILSAAKSIENEDITQENIRNIPLETARKELMRISGVGPKVADCVLLYGAGRFSAFPADVWIRRVLKENYGNENYDTSVFGPYAGLAQIYLFHHARKSAKNNIKGAV